MSASLAQYLKLFFQVRYDEDLQKYLKLTGLQASDLVKPRARKKKAQQHQAPAPQQQQRAEPSKQHHQANVQAAAAVAQSAQAQQLPMHLFPGAGQQMSPNQAMLLQNQLAHLQQQGQGAAAAAQGQANGPAVSWLSSYKWRYIAG